MKVHFSERGSLLCSPLPPLWIIHWNLIIWSWKHNPKSTLFLLLCSHYLIPCLWDLAWLARVPDCPTVPAQLADLSSGHITRVSDILHWYPIRIALYLYLHRYEAPEPHLPLSLMPMIKMLLSCKTNFNFSNMTNLYSCQAFESSLSLCLSQNDYSLSFSEWPTSHIAQNLLLFGSLTTILQIDFYQLTETHYRWAAAWMWDPWMWRANSTTLFK